MDPQQSCVTWPKRTCLGVVEDVGVAGPRSCSGGSQEAPERTLIGSFTEGAWCVEFPAPKSGPLVLSRCTEMGCPGGCSDAVVGWSGDCGRPGGRHGGSGSRCCRAGPAGNGCAVRRRCTGRSPGLPVVE